MATSARFRLCSGGGRGQHADRDAGSAAASGSRHVGRLRTAVASELRAHAGCSAATDAISPTSGRIGCLLIWARSNGYVSVGSICRHRPNALSISSMTSAHILLSTCRAATPSARSDENARLNASCISTSTSPRSSLMCRSGFARLRADGRQFDGQQSGTGKTNIAWKRVAARFTSRVRAIARASRPARRIDTSPALPENDGDEQLSVLPLSLAQERCFTVYRPLVARSIVNFAEGLDNLVDGLREIAPHAVMATPSIWQMLYATIATAIADASPLGRLAYRLALDAGLARTDRASAGRPASAAQRLGFFLARALVLDRAKTIIGLRRARLLLCNGAAMPRNCCWYCALGLNIVDTG